MKFQVLRALIIGNILEYYDFFLYTFFVSILSPHFFPSSDPLTALMKGFGLFAIGFIARPIGALVFGHFGDKYGRKNALFGTLFLMAVSTVGIGLLPTYDKIGILSTIFLVLFRLVQGFAAGGEVSGASVFGLEQTIETRRGFVGALIKSSAGIGAVMATTIGAISTCDLMPDWAWRIPFCLGGLVAFSGIYLRRVLEESEWRKPVNVPLLEVIQNHPISFLKAVGIGGFLHVPYYIIVGYMNATLHAKGLVSSFELMIMNTVITFVGITIIPVIGFYSDRIGLRRLMTWGTIGPLTLSLPLLMVYTTSENLVGIVLAQMIFLFFCEPFVAPSNAYLNTLFPPECRYTGVSFGICLGLSLFGGTTPLICSQLASGIGPIWGPSLYLMGAALMGLIAVWQRTPKPAFAHA